MQQASKAVLRFVRALLRAGPVTVAAEGKVSIEGDGGIVSLAAAEVEALISAGIIAGDGKICRPTPETRAWLRRQMLDADAFAAQHRIEAPTTDGAVINLAESPLALLSRARDGEPAFLARHQIEAGERVRRLVERAQLQPRTTMSYSAAHTAGGKAGSRPTDISDMAADARKELADIIDALPADCAGVVVDVCGLLKGLQLVEQERRWPRRSAKLVLRIGLEQVAQRFGLAAEAVGVATRRRHGWLAEGARPDRFE